MLGWTPVWQRNTFAGPVQCDRAAIFSFLFESAVTVANEGGLPLFFPRNHSELRSPEPSPLNRLFISPRPSFLPAVCWSLSLLSCWLSKRGGAAGEAMTQHVFEGLSLSLSVARPRSGSVRTSPLIFVSVRVRACVCARLWDWHCVR